MFSIKCQEIVDKNTGVHLAFGDHGKDKSTVWVRITAGDKITTVTLHRDGDVINIAPVVAAGRVVVEPEKPAAQKPHFVPPPKESLRSDEKRPKS